MFRNSKLSSGGGTFSDWSISDKNVLFQKMIKINLHRKAIFN